jgi:4-diphosphocytidyl-2C-methyl-D-erythritol kinase
LRKIKNKDENDPHSKSYRYEIVSQTEYRELQNSVHNALDAVQERIRQQLSDNKTDSQLPTGPVSAQSGSGPMNATPVKDFSQQPTKPTQKGTPIKKSATKAHKNTSDEATDPA